MKKNKALPKLNNAGLTLVELLVSIMIMSIIVLPILTSFVSSAKMNQKAKEQQRATLVAQNLMEEIKASGADTWINRTGITMYDAAGSVTDESDEAAAYEILVSNVESNGKTYDAVVTFTKNTDAAASTSTISLVNRISDSHDALVMSSGLALSEEDAISQISSALGYSVSASDICRTITVSVSGDSAQTATVSASYTYSYAYNTAVSVTKGPYTFFSASGSDATALEKVYLFYYPWYASTSYSTTDKIVFENTGRLDLDFIIVKQNDGDEDNLLTHENNYGVNVKIVENRTTGDTYATRVYSNLDVNLYSETALATSQGKFYADSDTTQAAYSGVTLATYALTATSDEGLDVYDLEVSVYEAGTSASADAIVTLSGGISD